MTSQQQWKHLVWLRWLRITRRQTEANISGDLILRSNEQRTMADAIDRYEANLPKEVTFKTLLQ